MRRNFATLLGIAFVVAILCTAAFYALVSSRLGGEVEANAGRKVVVAAREIPRGKTLSTGDVKVIPWTVSEPPTGAFTRASQVEGLTATRALGEGDAVTDTRAVRASGGGSLGIPAGMRAVSVHVSDSAGVLPLLKAGHRVDVQAIYTRSGGDAELRTVLQNIEVLRVGTPGENTGGKSNYPVATLLVTPAEADVVGLADAVARVRLVLRNPVDGEKLQRAGLAVSTMMRGNPEAGPVRAVVAARPAAPVRPAAQARPKTGLAAEGSVCNDRAPSVSLGSASSPGK